MAFTQTDLDNIRKCIGSGILETRFADGRRVMYQSLSDMMKAEQRIAAAVAAGSGRPRQTYPAWRNGN
jgi:hypothetical protein